MSHKKAGGSSRNGRDSQAKRPGIKHFGGEFVSAGSILVRQKGTKWAAGENTGMGRDFTIFSTVDGNVKFTEKRVQKFDRSRSEKTFVNVIPA